VLRKAVADEALMPIWQAVQNETRVGDLPCLSCGQLMTRIPMEWSGTDFALDVCRPCEFFWFDTNEFEALPKKSMTTTAMLAQPLPQAAREEIAKWEVRRMAERGRMDPFGNEAPDLWWQQVLAFLGMPIELDNPVQTRPWITWALVTLMVAFSVVGFLNPTHVIHQFGLDPTDPWRVGGLTWITAFFLHAGILHLLGNAYFLMVFGDNVEDFLGRIRFLLLVTLATIAGDALHILLDGRSSAPLVGASGGISGVITFYALQFPNARLSFLFRVYFYFRWVSIPAWAAFALWILYQSLGIWLQLKGFSSVSALAHFGGVVAGLGAWCFWRNRHSTLVKT